MNELTQADITASVIFQATLPPPGRVMPCDLDVQKAIHMGEDRFAAFGCAGCHVPRLKPDKDGIVWVPAFTDLKLHDICSGPDDPNGEPLDMQAMPGSPTFFAGNRKFLTRKLWGTANEPPFFHHGQFTTIRESVLAHSGEALKSRQAFEAASAYEQDSLIEFLKTLQVLPPDARELVVYRNAVRKAASNKR